jgi:GT2 family glycosyltransferase
MKEPLVGVIIVNWNCWPDTVECIRSLHHQTYREWRVIVVDNDSSDDSLSRIIEAFPTATIVSAGGNIGWAAANNLGVKAASALGCEYVWLLNPDAIALTDTLPRLVEAAIRVNSEPWILGALQKRTAQSPSLELVAITDPKTNLPDKFVDSSELNLTCHGLLPVSFVTGCALFVSTEVFNTVGHMDESYFLYFDETDWCRRAASRGVRSAYVKDAHIIHSGSAVAGSAARPLQTYFMIRNRLRYARKHLKPLQLLQALRWTKWELERVANLEGDERHWLIVLCAPRSPRTQAISIGIRDFALRRHGDCPAYVRTLHSSCPT